MQDKTAELHAYLATLNAEADLATVAVKALDGVPVTQWAAVIDAHPEWLSFGPLNALLESDRAISH
jgi:hypothetical protein